MKLFALISILSLMIACSDSSSKIVSRELVKVTTPDGVEIRDGEISQVLTNQEYTDRFVAYLESQNIYYRLDDRFPNEVSWIPESEEHREKITREAFGIPVNQVQKVFDNAEDFDKYVSVLNSLDIEHVAQPFEGHFVVIWTPGKEGVEESVNVKYQQ